MQLMKIMDMIRALKDSLYWRYILRETESKSIPSTMQGGNKSLFFLSIFINLYILILSLMNIHKKILEKHGITQSSPQVQIEAQSPMKMDEKVFLERLQECTRLNSHGNVFMTSTVFPKSISVKNDAKIPLAVCIQPYGESVYVIIELIIVLTHNLEFLPLGLINHCDKV